ncbi:uncharacterized protein RJT21DRAFT_51829 [Scheffersomyces amazonensis]|uniref:uncharacterized protein n=1 Tax=Scheffersomyces amazonensis TaxID=1078765 RepID=UPI00315CCD85
MSNLIPKDLVPYLDYLPDITLQVLVNSFMTFTPLFSYGTTCYGIYKKRTSTGFSIDICATMLMASILRIYYYFISPYEITLFRQSCIMIIIQCILLKISLKYRPYNYDPDFLTPLPVFKHELNTILPRRLSASTLPVEHESYYVDNSLSKSILLIADDTWKYFKIYFYILFRQLLKFFDVYYLRPYQFWQWKDENRYWKFILSFAGVFGILTLIFHNSLKWGQTLGILGLFIESLLPLPQILLLNRLQSIKNFKIILLLSWLGGDLTKLSYLIYGTSNISIIFIVAALFQMGLDIIIAYQYIHYKYKETDNDEDIETQLQGKLEYELPVLSPSSTRDINNIVNELVNDSNHENIELKDLA